MCRVAYLYLKYFAKGIAYHLSARTITAARIHATYIYIYTRNSRIGTVNKAITNQYSGISYYITVAEQRMQSEMNSSPRNEEIAL